MTMQASHRVNPTFTPVPPGTEYIQLVPVAPAGDYTLLIDGADYISHRHGAFLRLAMHVGDGIRFGTPIVLDLHLDHIDDYLSQPAQVEFNKLMQVIRYPELLDADDLIGCCFRATIGKRQASAAHRTENYLSAVHEGAWTPDGERAEVARTRPAALLPVGEYSMVIVASEYVPNTAGTGMLMEMEAVITDGPYEGMRGPYSMVLEGPGQEGGQRELAALRRATGILSPRNSAELYHIPFRARVDVILKDGVLANSVEVAIEVEDAYARAPQRDERGRFVRRAA